MSSKQLGFGLGTAEDFKLSAGTMTVIGPASQQHRTCVSGQVCAFVGILGQHLSVQGRVLVQETCGSDVVNDRFPSAGYVTDVSISGAGVSWGSTKVSAAGGQYRLCWCDGSVSFCGLSRDFATDFGRLTIVGVAPLKQSRTCVSGQPCSLQGITGQDLSHGDLWMAMDTCGQQNFIPRFAHAGASQKVSASGSEIAWGPIPPTAAGGQYRLCWCSIGFACVSGEDFFTDAGSLTLLGMSPNMQDRTCISGQVCVLRGLQGTFHDAEVARGSSLLALDTCGLPGVLPRFSKAGTIDQDRDDGGGAATAYRTEVAITTAGGQYRLCWCSGAGLCEISEQHNVDMGTLFVLGPWPLSQEWTCISGQTCRLYAVNGEGLQASDTFAVLETCGSESAPDHFPAAGVLDRDSGLTSEVVLSFSADIITAAASEYRLCWCSSAITPCSSSLSAITDFGKLSILGPGPLHQDRTCASGQTCRMTGIVGRGMTASDSFIVQDTCGIADSLPGFPQRSFPTIAHASGAAVDWGTVPVTSAGGLYRLCWCSGLTSTGCSNAQEFTVDVGSLTLVGISPLNQAKTCVSGMTCEISGLLGNHLSSLDQYLVLETCGDASSSALQYTRALEGFEEPGKSPSTRLVSLPLPLTGGEYRLCWCSGQFLCSVQENFRVDAGAITVIGVSPFSQDRTCVSGRTCFLRDIVGSGLSSNDVLFVLETCGEDNAIARFPFSGKANLHESEAGTTFSQLERITSAGGVFRLCWCHGLGFEDDCLVARAAVMDVGSLFLIGAAPLSQDRTCVAGAVCSIAGILGQGLQEKDLILVMDTCGLERSLVAGFPSTGTTALTEEGTSFSWAFQAISAAGGIYQLCWCSAEGYYDETCGTAAHADITLGQLYLVGVSPLSQDHTCIAGQTCRIEGLTGQNLPKVGSMLLVLETCGFASIPATWSHADPWPLTNALGEVQDFQSSSSLTSAGYYRLCWCSGFGPCTSTADFNIDVGRFTLVGPFPLQQEATCVGTSVCKKYCSGFSQQSDIQFCIS